MIHDFRRGDESIVWIAGNVTQRHTGGSMSRIGVAMRSEGDAAADRVNYLTRTSHGKVRKSTTTVLRDVNGRAFGLFCINLDISAFSALEAMLNELLHGTESNVLTKFAMRCNCLPTTSVCRERRFTTTSKRAGA